MDSTHTVVSEQHLDDLVPDDRPTVRFTGANVVTGAEFELSFYDRPSADDLIKLINALGIRGTTVTQRPRGRRDSISPLRYDDSMLNGFFNNPMDEYPNDMSVHGAR